MLLNPRKNNPRQIKQATSTTKHWTCRLAQSRQRVVKERRLLRMLQLMSEVESSTLLGLGMIQINLYLNDYLILPKKLIHPPWDHDRRVIRCCGEEKDDTGNSRYHLHYRRLWISNRSFRGNDVRTLGLNRWLSLDMTNWTKLAVKSLTQVSKVRKNWRKFYHQNCSNNRNNACPRKIKKMA